MFDSTNNWIIIPEDGKWLMQLTAWLGLPNGLSLPTSPFRYIAQIQYKLPSETTSRGVRQEIEVAYNSGVYMLPALTVVWVDHLPQNTIVKGGVWQNSGTSLSIWGGTRYSPSNIDGEPVTYTVTSLAVWKYAA